MTLDEQVTKIARNMAYSIHVGRGPVLQGTIDGIKSACYAAIRAFAEQEPSEAMLAAASDAILDRVMSFDSLYTAIYRAMQQQALKELDHE